MSTTIFEHSTIQKIIDLPENLEIYSKQELLNLIPKALNLHIRSASQTKPGIQEIILRLKRYAIAYLREHETELRKIKLGTLIIVNHKSDANNNECPVYLVKGFSPSVFDEAVRFNIAFELIELSFRFSKNEKQLDINTISYLYKPGFLIPIEEVKWKNPDLMKSHRLYLYKFVTNCIPDWNYGKIFQ